MGRLDGKVSLVLGGAGYVGEGIVRSFLEEGAFVIVPSRSPERLDGLRKLVGGSDRLVTVLANVGSPQGAEALKTQILTKMSRLDAVVASLGGWWEGAKLIDLSIDELGKVLNDNLISHFVAAKAFLPALARFPGSTYTMIAGLAGEIPVAGSGPVSVAMAAQQAMQRVLAEEQKDSGVRINELLVKSVMSRARGEAGPETLTAEEVGKFAAKLASKEGEHWNGVQIRLLDRMSYEMAMR
jgi:NAD(P)-dependent dehydrogenase (short-subunit alcohol dehydrogenase family)